MLSRRGPCVKECHIVISPDNSVDDSLLAVSSFLPEQATKARPVRARPARHNIFLNFFIVISFLYYEIATLKTTFFTGSSLTRTFG